MNPGSVTVANDKNSAQEVGFLIVTALCSWLPCHRGVSSWRVSNHWQHNADHLMQESCKNVDVVTSANGFIKQYDVKTHAYPVICFPISTNHSILQYSHISLVNLYALILQLKKKDHVSKKGRGNLYLLNHRMLSLITLWTLSTSMKRWVSLSRGWGGPSGSEISPKSWSEEEKWFHGWPDALY